MDPVSAALPQNLRCNLVARCNSYTTLVHHEINQKRTQQTPNNLNTLVQAFVEWLVVLQRLEEERRMDLPPVNCRCNKARIINEELKSVGRSLSSMSKLGERLGTRDLKITRTNK